MLLLIFNSACKKFLDAKPSSKLAIPNSLNDLQALLDHPTSFTSLDGGISGESSATDYYLLPADFEALREFERNTYLWASANVYPEGTNDWGYLYRHMYTSTVIIENIAEIQRNNTNAVTWDNVKGQAHFVRAKLMFTGAQIWCLVYDDAYADIEPGMVIRADSDFNKVSKRSSLRETFQYILADATAATQLLSEQESFLTRANKAAAFALLARVQLYMGDDKGSLLSAERALAIKNELLDYNTLNATSAFPIPQLNKEVLFHHSMVLSHNNLANARARVDKMLYDSYEDQDLRKRIYFRINADGTIGFKGSYTGNNGYFSGMLLDEVYLIAAEGYAKANRLGESATALNKLLSKRYKTGQFTDYTFSSRETALDVIYRERRKTLIFRGLRWGDIKRLNREGLNITLRREVNGDLLTLKPQDRRFAMPIPEGVISLSEVSQNSY